MINKKEVNAMRPSTNILPEYIKKRYKVTFYNDTTITVESCDHDITLMIYDKVIKTAIRY
jgi:hypothetical protein